MYACVYRVHRGKRKKKKGRKRKKKKRNGTNNKERFSLLIIIKAKSIVAILSALGMPLTLTYLISYLLYLIIIITSLIFLFFFNLKNRDTKGKMRLASMIL